MWTQYELALRALVDAKEEQVTALRERVEALQRYGDARARAIHTYYLAGIGTAVILVSLVPLVWGMIQLAKIKT